MSEATPQDPGTDRVGVPQSVGPYQVIRLVSQNTLSSVYECAPLYPGAHGIAVKVLEAPTADSTIFRRFEREFASLQQLDHPSVVRVLSFGWTDNHSSRKPYIAMQFVTGMRLCEYLTDHNPPLSKRIQIIRSLADALQHIHNHGIVHRDLKPSNILISDSGNPVIIDFGIALTDPGTNTQSLHTMTGHVAGTPMYMSPEQMRGEKIDSRSDVFTLGVIAYEMMSGQHPFNLNRVPVTKMSETLHEVTPLPLGSIVRASKSGLDVIIGKAIEIDIRDRYQSAALIHEELNRLQNGLPISAGSPTTFESVVRWSRRHPTLSKGILFLAASLILSVSVIGMYRSQVRRAEMNEIAGEQSAKMLRVLLSQDYHEADSADKAFRKAMLDQFVANFDSLELNPAARTQCRVAIAESLIMMGDNQSSLDQYPKILEEHTRLYGPDDRRTILMHIRYAKRLQQSGQSEIANHELESILGVIPKSTDSDLRGRVYYAEGIIREQQQRLEDALSAYTKAEPLLESASGNAEAEILQMYALYRIARVARSLDKPDLAISTLQKLIPLAEVRLGDTHRDTVLARQDLADLIEVKP
jgi:serine/threonine protein kinase